MIHLDQDDLHDACHGFGRDRPHESARRTFYVTQLLAFTVIAAFVVWSYLRAPSATTDALHAATYLLFLSLLSWRLAAAARLQPRLSRIASPASWPAYTILCPLYREAAGVASLCQALSRIDYPQEALDIKLLVESDDQETVSAAHDSARNRPNIEVIALAPASPRTKPKALSAGLKLARGEFLTVYDAEDRPHPMQLRAALAAFEDGDAHLACVQAPLAIDNGSASWISDQLAAEYAVQFREVLPLLAELRLPIPLGGSSNHFKVDALKQVGGWDPHNVTEDADLGYRLARYGFRTGAIGPPTWEEAPVTFSAWLPQRTRWIKGHMQTWLVLMRRPFRVAREMGWRAFLSMQIVLGGGILTAFVHAPIAVLVLATAISPDTSINAADVGLAIVGYCTGALAALSACALTGSLGPARAALSMPLYWPLSSIAAWRALFELICTPHHWAKTAHGVSPRHEMPA